MSEFKLIVSGKSMTPAFCEGDILLVKRDYTAGIKTGNAIVFESPRSEDWVVHRVIGVECPDGEERYITQGDSCSDPDEVVPLERIIGKVVGRLKNNRRVTIPRWKELFWLHYAGWHRKARRIRYKGYQLMVPLISPLIAARLIPLKRVQVGERQLTVIFGKIVAIKEDTPQGTLVWVHPLFRRIKSLKPNEN